MIQHGNLSTYRSGCRCGKCSTVANKYQKRLRYDHSNGRYRLVDASRAHQHIHDLREQGMTWASIAAALGHSATPVVHRMMKQKRIRQSTEQRILAIDVHHGAGQGYVDVLGTRRRLQALAAIGYTQRWLAEQMGVGTQAVSEIVKGRFTTVRAYIADAARDLYKEYRHTVGPSATARTVAKRNGWYPPLSWDDIDNPKERGKR